MHIHSIEISNYRSIGNTPPLKLYIDDITVLSGINDTGKTSALLSSFIGLNNILNNGKYISELLVGSEHRNGYKIETIEQFIRVAFKCTDKDGDEIWNYILQDDEFERLIQDLTESGIDIENDKVKDFLKNAVIQLKIPMKSSAFDPATYANCIDREFWINFVEKYFGYQNIDDFSKYLYRTIHKVTGLETAVENMNCLFVPSVTRSKEHIILKEENQKSQLMTFFKSISSENGRIRGEYDFFMNSCKILFPELVRIEINNPTGDEKSEELFLTWNQNGNEKYQPLSRSGDGIYNTLYLLAKLLNNSTVMSIVFIDEPEIGLHPMLQQRFVKLLRMLSRTLPIKWVLATHSPFILNSLKGKEKLYLIKHNGIQTHCQDIDITNKEIVFNSLGAYLPLALAAKGVIFVEGQTEVTVLTILLNKVGLNTEEEGILIIPLGGDNLFKIAPKELKKLHEKSMVIIDSDLSAPLGKGGNIKQRKLNYGSNCKDHNVEFLMIKEYRTLENMYPKTVLAKVLNTEVENLNYGAFEIVSAIPEESKVKIGNSVATKMSEEEAENFPPIKEIKKWWNEK